jgi:hypothetical protein
MHKNTVKKAKLIKAIVDEHYEPMSHRNSLRDIWRNKVVKVYPISEATFYRLVEYAIRLDGYVGAGNNRVYRQRKAEKDDIDKRQLKLF